MLTIVSFLLQKFIPYETQQKLHRSALLEDNVFGTFFSSNRSGLINSLKNKKKTTQMDSLNLYFKNFYLNIVLNSPTIKAPAKDSPLLG